VTDALTPLKEKLAALTSRPESQRRMITVLFADVQNFTAMSEKVDMETVRDTMFTLWKKIDGLIVAQGGGG
jgi:class 3 adenylate cyclase